MPGALAFERFVGVRYLHRARPARGVRATFIGSLALAALGFGVFFASRGRLRAGETVGVLAVLFAALGVAWSVLMRAFSVFTAVSTMGVVLGVASLVVVLAVTSGFEREFQDKVLALNAHLIVIPYGDVDIDSPEADRIIEKLRGTPGVVQMAKFLFSAGEVMVGRIGANLKGVDLKDGADDLRRALIAGRVEDLEKPATCPLPSATPGEARATSDVGRIALGAELAHKLHLDVGSCVSIMIPFSTGSAAPPSFLFKVVGLFRMGFNEYDTRLAYVSLADARKIASARGSVFGVELRFADPMMALKMTDEVRRRLDAPYRVIDWKELNHNLFMALTMQKLMVSLVLVLIIVVAAFNILASLTMIVLSKFREIAILQAMGARRPTIARIFLVAGVTVGGIGTGLGLLFGLLACFLARLYGYPLDPKVYLIGELPVRVAPIELLEVAAATLAICCIATLYPAWRASRLRAVDGLRYN
ncbi:MAG TPA: FtsX-like permease family protein [Polyangia bacterium]|nr:FtsX-like permease family protein [Polyangia bacterium]